MNPIQFKKIARGFLFLLGISILTCFALAQGPNIDLHFLREVPSKLDPLSLDRNLYSVSRWPQWYFSLNEATLLTETPETDLKLKSEIRKGSQVKLSVDPHKGAAKRFEVIAEVTEYVPGRLLSMKILSDSSGRLSRLFENIEWKLELVPTDQGTLLRGTARARTAHWRSRLFGRMAERIIMNQIFYWDLITLSELKQPFSSGKNPNPPRSSFGD